MKSQDKKEMLEMIASAVMNTHVVSHAENSLMWCLSNAIKAKAASLSQDNPDRKSSYLVYAECDDCSAKPGSPTLCNICSHNRELAGRLIEENRKLNNIIMKLSEPL